jgi:hypothetical protein
MNSCAICMKEGLKNEDIYTTDCNHSFCKSCLDDWFKRGNQTCPLCRSHIDTYIYRDENYKLIIYNVSSRSNRNTIDQISITDLIDNNENVRNIVKRHMRLRFYTISITFLFIYLLNCYINNLQNINMIQNKLNDCNTNNTILNDNLNDCNDNLSDSVNLGSGYYISMYNGIISRRCFYPINFYNMCFK